MKHGGTDERDLICVCQSVWSAAVANQVVIGQFITTGSGQNGLFDDAGKLLAGAFIRALHDALSVDQHESRHALDLVGDAHVDRLRPGVAFRSGTTDRYY